MMNNIDNSKYNMGFVAGALLHKETILIAEIYSEKNNWDDVYNTVLLKNLLQTRTLSTCKRISREIIARLKMLTSNELEILLYATIQEQSHLLWLALCRRHRFIAEFAKEIIHEHFVVLKPTVDYDDFDAFFNKKSEWHTELENIAITTKKKIRQVLFRMLKEADILEKNNSIIPSILSPLIFHTITANNKDELLLFPVADTVEMEYSI